MMENTLFSSPLEVKEACNMIYLLATSLVLQAAGMASQYVGEKQKAKDTEAYQNHLAETQKKQGLRKATSQNLQQAQVQEETARKKFATTQEAAKLASNSRLVGAGKVAGLSMDHLQQSFEAQEATYLSSLSIQQDMKDAAYLRSGESMMQTMQQQMYATKAPVDHPNALAYGLKAGAQMAKTGAAMYDAKAKADESSEGGPVIN